MIIDELRMYAEPVFIYLPPQSQLRGGAWVVMDPAINADHMELYADPVACRAGVLEPEGTVEIKYRRADLCHTLSRLDDKCHQLREQLRQARKQTPSLVASEREIQAELDKRQKDLLPIYQQVCVCLFVDCIFAVHCCVRHIYWFVVDTCQSRFCPVALRRLTLVWAGVIFLDQACCCFCFHKKEGGQDHCRNY